MSSKIIKIAIVFFSTIIVLSSCNKAEIDINFKPVGYVGDISIHDLLLVNDSIMMFCGETQNAEGRIGTYNINSRKVTLENTSGIIYDLSKSSTSYWACGENMLLLQKDLNGTEWDTYHSFKYLYEEDKTDLKKIHALGDNPTFAIGRKHMLYGNFYYPNTTPFRPFLSKQLQTGANDLLIIDTTEAYIAAYGSIFYVKNDTTLPTYTSAGGENFTGITLSGERTIVSCTFNGGIYIKEHLDSIWRKTLDSDIPFKHIVSDTYGNIVVYGDSKQVAISNDFGENWKFAKYSGGKDVTTVILANRHFWIGTAKGEIIRFNRDLF